MAAKKGKARRDRLPLRRTCGTMGVHMALLERFPAFRENQRKLELSTERMRSIRFTVDATPVVRIRTIVNVVYKLAEENISDRQIRDQISILNQDFRAQNRDRSGTPAPWKGLVADSRMEFELVDVTRTETDRDSFDSANDGVKSARTGGKPPTSPNDSLNIWVCALDSLLGYAQFPGGPSATDGVVVNYAAFGSTGTAQSPYDRGRTSTHEIGHYFNLRHIWGDTPDCSGSDMVADTPNCAGPNYGTPTWPKVSCGNGPNGDMFMNYMDYTDDASMFMFTTGQIVRMRAALDGPRSGLK